MVGVRFPAEAGNFSLRHRVQTASGAHPASYPVGTGGSQGVKRPAREADHSSPSSAEVKNGRSYTSTPQYTSMAWCSVKAQGQLYLSPYLTHIYGPKYVFRNDTSYVKLGSITHFQLCFLTFILFSVLLPLFHSCIVFSLSLCFYFPVYFTLSLPSFHDGLLPPPDTLSYSRELCNVYQNARPRLMHIT